MLPNSTAAPAIFNRHGVWNEQWTTPHNPTSHSRRPHWFQNVFAYIITFGGEKKTIYNQHISCFQCKSIFLNYLVNFLPGATHRPSNLSQITQSLGKPFINKYVWGLGLWSRFHTIQSNLMKILSFYPFHVDIWENFVWAEQRLWRKAVFYFSRWLFLIQSLP